MNSAPACPEALRQGHHGAQDVPDDGFTLIEVMVAMGIIAVVMAGVSMFAVRSLSVVGQQRARHAAILVADGAMERVRALPGASLADRRDQASTTQQWAEAAAGVRTYLNDLTPAFDTAPAVGSPTLPLLEATTINGVRYTVQWYVGRCWQATSATPCTAVAARVEFFRVIVAVSWASAGCGGDLCSYVTTTLSSTTNDDAVFNTNDAAIAPAISYPPPQTLGLGDDANLQMVASGGSPPLSWSGTGLPDGLTVRSDGVVVGTATRTGSFTATVSVTDSFGLQDSIAFPWRVSTMTCADPGARTAERAAPVSFTVSCTGGTAPLSWVAAGLPPGLSIDSSTGAVTGRPTTAGVSSATITATDSRGRSSAVSFSWTVIVVPYASLVLADQPLGYWRMSDTQVTQALDSSGNGWHGAYQGGPTFNRAGALAQDTDTATAFNGSTTRMSAPDRNDFVGQAPFSLEVWVRPASFGASGDYKVLIRKAAGGDGFYMWMNSVYGFGFERTASSQIGRIGTGPVSAGAWYHVVGTYDGMSMRVYLNGVLKQQGYHVTAMADNTAVLDIGFYPTLPSYVMNGDLDEVAVYGTALSAARVTAHYEKGRSG